MRDHAKHPKQLRSRAEECRALADVVGTGPGRASYLKLAHAYELLAQQEEALGPTPIVRSAATSIASFLDKRSFDPELIEAMSGAFENVCRAIGLSDRADPLTKLVARHIIEAAQCGMRTKLALFATAMLKFKSDPN